MELTPFEISPRRDAAFANASIVPASDSRPEPSQFGAMIDAHLRNQDTQGDRPRRPAAAAGRGGQDATDDAPDAKDVDATQPAGPAETITAGKAAAETTANRAETKDANEGDVVTNDLCAADNGLAVCEPLTALVAPPLPIVGAVQLLSLPIEFTDAPPETTVETAAVSAAPLLPPAFPPVAAPPERVPGLSDSVTSQTDAPFDTQKAAELPTSTIVTPDSAKQPTPVAAGRRELGDRPLPPGLVDFAARAEPARTLPAPLRTDGIAPTVVPAPVAQEVVSPTVVPPVANGSTASAPAPIAELAPVIEEAQQLPDGKPMRIAVDRGDSPAQRRTPVSPPTLFAATAAQPAAPAALEADEIQPANIGDIDRAQAKFLAAVEDARREDPADDVDLVPIDADAEKETSPAPVATPPRDIQAAAPTAIERATQVSSSRPPVHPVVEQVVVHLAKAAADAIDRIKIELHPAELGRVDVRMEIGPSGHVQAVFAADRPQTMELLQRDARQLERALQDAGLNVGSGSLSFDLRGQGREFAGRETPSSFAAPNETEVPLDLVAAASQAYGGLGSGAGRLDIRV